MVEYIKITSKDNKIIKDLVELRDDKKVAMAKSLFFVEGYRIIKDIDESLIDSIYIDENMLGNDFVAHIDKRKYILSAQVFDKVKGTVNSQGIVALVKDTTIKNIKSIDINKIKFCLVLDNIQDPGNVGTILRLAETVGIDLVVMSKETCSIYNQKVIRASMSSITRLNIYLADDVVETISYLKRNGFKCFASTLTNDAKNLYSIEIENKNCLVVGNEANGIKKEIIDICNEKVFIPMEGHIESLNVAIATAVMCYEMKRKKAFEI